MSRLARSSVGGPSSRGSARRSRALRALGCCPGFLGLGLLLLVDGRRWSLLASEAVSANAALFQKVSRNVANSEPLESKAISATVRQTPAYLSDAAGFEHCDV